MSKRAPLTDVIDLSENDYENNAEKEEGGNANL